MTTVVDTDDVNVSVTGEDTTMIGDLDTSTFEEEDGLAGIRQSEKPKGCCVLM
jgi:hypothetical protein